MTDLGPVAWPPAPIRTERLVLREGIVTLDRRDAERTGHIRSGGGEAERGYMFLPEAWGCGYAGEQWLGVWPSA